MNLRSNNALLSDASLSAALRQPNSTEGPRMAIRLTRNFGMLLLAIWLILTGLMPLLHLSFSGAGTMMAILAIAAGVLILVVR
jgi:hypothetical protein